MDLGMRIRWGRVVEGKETDALELFQDAVTYYGKKMADGKVTFFEPFLLSTGDVTKETGFFIVKGPVAEMFKIFEEEEYKILNTRAHVLLEHFAVDLLQVGEEIEHQLKRFQKLTV